MYAPNSTGSSDVLNRRGRSSGSPNSGSGHQPSYDAAVYSTPQASYPPAASSQYGGGSNGFPAPSSFTPQSAPSRAAPQGYPPSSYQGASDASYSSQTPTQPSYGSSGSSSASTTPRHSYAASNSSAGYSSSAGYGYADAPSQGNFPTGNFPDPSSSPYSSPQFPSGAPTSSQRRSAAAASGGYSDHRPSSHASDNGVGRYVASSSPSPMDRRRNAQQNSDSLRHYTVFMYGLCLLSVACMVVCVLTMGAQSMYLVLVLAICLCSFLFTLSLTRWIFTKDDQNQQMRVISEAIREGSEGFLRVQYTSIATIAFIIAAALFLLYLFRASPSPHISSLTLAGVTALSYLVGAFCSGLAGYIGVWVSVRVNIRVSVSASKLNYSDSLLLSFRGGAVSACLSASLCILGLTVLYTLCHLLFTVMGGLPASHVPLLLAGYSFGGALVALFMQLGGGIYTKAADVGADMCGKIEAGIPEDDPRNPAVIADLVGDNVCPSVGDCAGSMADIFESIAAEIIGTMILGAALAEEAGIPHAEPFIFFPLIVHSLDLLVSGLGIVLVHARSDKEDPIDSMQRSYLIAMGCAAVGFVFACWFCLSTPVAPAAWWHYALCGLIGIAMSFALIRITQYYTDYNFAPVRRIAGASATGHGTNVIAGLSVGLESTGLPILIICISLWSAFSLGQSSGLPAHSAGIFGTAVATMGMLCTAVFVLSMNNFGPIADNAGGICEMGGQPEEVRRITDRLDAVGNVTKAASKGYAVGGSALSCFVLFQAFIDEMSDLTASSFTSINIAKVEVVIGGLLGVMMIFVFAGWAIAAVGSTAQKVVWEVRRQLKDSPGIMEGTEKPDYETCVKIVTKAALTEMIAPALLALGMPIAVGFTFRMIGEATGRPLLGLEVVGAFMIVGTLTGLCMAVFMDNAGGAWDNAKKLIESRGEKGTEQHKAAVTGDTVGDPCKDTAGPALHVIITTMATTLLILGPVFVGPVPSA